MFLARRCGRYLGLLIILSFISIQYFHVQAQDDYGAQHDAEMQLKEDLRKKRYDVDVLPPHNCSCPVKIHVSMALKLVKDLDLPSSTLTTVSYIYLEWTDSRLAWNQSMYSGVDALRVPPNFLWRPQVKLCNSAVTSMIDTNGDVFAIVHPDGLVVHVPPKTYHSICQINLKYYPYDEHECILRFGLWIYDIQHFDLESDSDDIDLSEFCDGGEWEVVHTATHKEIDYYNSTYDMSYTYLDFHISLKRRSPFYKMVIVCPVLGAVFLILTSFWVSPVARERITMNCVALFTLVAILLYLAARLPAVGNNVPLIVAFCGLVTLLAVFIIITTVIFVGIANSRKNEQLPQWITSVLQSRITSIFRVTMPTSFDKFSNHYGAETRPTDSDKEQFILTKDNSNPWIPFFQLIDRFSFIICVIVMISIFTSASI